MAGIFGKSKELEDMLEKQMELNGKISDKLKIAERNLLEYQKFLDFIDEKVEKKGWQLCGVKKHKDDDSVNLRSPSPVLDERSRRSLRCCVDGVFDSPYTSSNLRTDGQPDCSGSDCLQQSSPDGKPSRGLTSIDEYIAYFLESKLEEEPQYRYNYNIYAYSSLSFSTPVYKAYLGWCFKERFTVGRVLHIDNHYVTSRNLQGHGIGTESMNIIKALAKQLQCDGIQGTREALNYAATEEERKIEEEKLYKFYEKNGFIQSREHRNIFLPLKKAVKEKFLKYEG